ncbi:hypothetical protein [Thiolapillus sp.]|uniref:hypothetical protein n=1 Tax=Thiolapillus sp. TaxID=2017437 RepID=UPI003AF52316
MKKTSIYTVPAFMLLASSTLSSAVISPGGAQRDTRVFNTRQPPSYSAVAEPENHRKSVVLTPKKTDPPPIYGKIKASAGDIIPAIVCVDHVSIVGYAKSIPRSASFVTQNCFTKGVNIMVAASDGTTKQVKAAHKALVETLNRLFDGLGASFATTMKNFGAAQDRAFMERAVGETRRLGSDCETPDLANALFAGEADINRRIVLNGYRANIHNNSASTPSGAVKRMFANQAKRSEVLQDLQPEGGVNDPDKRLLAAELIFRTGTSLPDDADVHSAVVDYVSELTNPTPSPALPKELVEKVTGKTVQSSGNAYSPEVSAAVQKYHAVRTTKNDRLALAQQTLFQISEDNIASIEATDELNTIWKNMGGIGEFPGGVIGDDGKKKVSVNEMLKLMVDARLSNANWASDVNGLLQEGLTQRMVFMQALELRLLYEIMDTQKRLLAIEATRFSDDTNKTYNPPLDQLRATVISGRRTK